MTVHQLITEGYGVSSNLILEGYTSRGSKFREVLAKLESINPAQSMWDADLFEPGVFLEGSSEFQKVLEALK